VRQPGPLYTIAAGVVLVAGLGVANLAHTSTTVGHPAATTTAASTTAATTTAAPGAGVSTGDAGVEVVTTSLGPPPKPVVAPDRGNYAGKADGHTGSVAVSMRDGHAIAYVCDGRKVEAWLAGTMTSDGHFDLHDVHGAVLTGTWAASTAGSGVGGSVHGSVTVGGRIWHFTVGPTRKPAGLYRATPKVKGRSGKVGWIVRPDGTQTGILTVHGVSTAAPTLDPSTGTATVDGNVVHAEPISGLTGKGDF
jgi:serine/threonine-protein kinase